MARWSPTPTSPVTPLPGTLLLTAAPDFVLRIGDAPEELADISDTLHHVTYADSVSRTIEVYVKRFTDVTAEYLEEIIRTWTSAPEGVLSRILDRLSALDLAKLREALELIEYVIRLLVQLGGPALEMFQAFGWDRLA